MNVAIKIILLYVNCGGGGGSVVDKNYTQAVYGINLKAFSSIVIKI